MKNKLLVLERSLTVIGLKKEASLIHKLAVPLEDAIPLYQNKKETIGQSSRRDWFDSVESLKDNIVLIHFNNSSIEKKEDYIDFVKKLSELFSSPVNLTDPNMSRDDIDKQYIKLKYNSSVFDKAPASSGVDFNSFKRIFPDAASKAEASLSGKGLETKDVIFFLFNEQTYEGGFGKTAPYFAHDLGHIAWDNFKHKHLSSYFSKVLFDLSDCFKKEDGESLKVAAQKVEESLRNRLFSELLSVFIKEIFSDKQDALADLVTLCANPNNTVTIDSPNEFILSEFFQKCMPGPKPENYQPIIYKLEDKGKAKSILEEFIKNFRNYISKDELPPNEVTGDELPPNEKNESGLLPDEMKGKVYLMDLQ